EKLFAQAGRVERAGLIRRRRRWWRQKNLAVVRAFVRAAFNVNVCLVGRQRRKRGCAAAGGHNHRLGAAVGESGKIVRKKTPFPTVGGAVAGMDDKAGAFIENAEHGGGIGRIGGGAIRRGVKERGRIPVCREFSGEFVN